METTTTTTHNLQPVIDEKEKNFLNFTKPVIVHEARFGLVTLREFSTIKQFKLKGSVLITSFPSTSLSSILTGGYLREQLHLPLLGSLSSPNFPSRCILEDGVPVAPIRIFGDSSLCVVVCEFSIGAPESFHVVEALFDFVERHEISSIIGIEGMAFENPGQPQNLNQREMQEFGSKLSFITSNLDFAKAMKEMGHQALYSNVLNGLNGRILEEGTYTSKFDVSCLVAPTSPRFPDANSSVTVLRSLSIYLNLTGLDLTPLEKKAQALGFSVNKFLKSEEESKHSSQSMYL